MAYVEVKIIRKGTEQDLQQWKEHMLEEPKCWNRFCFECYSKEELCAVHVSKEGNSDYYYITTLCYDCLQHKTSYGILVDEKYMMVAYYHKKT